MFCVMHACHACHNNHYSMNCFIFDERKNKPIHVWPKRKHQSSMRARRAHCKSKLTFFHGQWIYRYIYIYIYINIYINTTKSSSTNEDEWIYGMQVLQMRTCCKRDGPISWNVGKLLREGIVWLKRLTASKRKKTICQFFMALSSTHTLKM